MKPAAAEKETSSAPSQGRILEPRRRRPRFALGPRTLDRYVARIFLQAFLACAVSFCGIYVMVEAFTKLSRFLKLEEPLWLALIQYHAAMVPTIYVNYLGPILTTAAAVATAVTLQRGNELTPIQASGVSLHRALAPVFALALLSAGFTYFLQESVIPRLRGPIRRAISLTRNGALRPDSFFDTELGQFIKVSEYSPAKQVGRGVEVHRRFPDGGIREILRAEELIWEPAPGSQGGPDRGRWSLHHGSIQRWNEEGKLVENPGEKDFDHLMEPFQSRVLEGSLLPIDLETSDQDISYLSWEELRTQSKRQPLQRHLKVKLHHHLAFPMAHLFLPALAIPIVLALGMRSLLLAVAESAVLCALFFLITSFSMSIAAHSERFTPELAVWLPVLLFGSLGVTLLGNLRS